MHFLCVRISARCYVVHCNTPFRVCWFDTPLPRTLCHSFFCFSHGNIVHLVMSWVYWVEDTTAGVAVYLVLYSQTACIQTFSVFYAVL